MVKTSAEKGQFLELYFKEGHPEKFRVENRKFVG